MENESELGGIIGMRSACYLLILIALACSIRSNAADLPPLPPELQSLDIASGKWEYNGENLATSDQKAEKWTWSQDCAWSANRAFMACGFVMRSPGKVVKSLSVSTFNYTDKHYWHYEVFDSDGSGADPFISQMTLSGNTWTNYGKADKKTYRVIYHFTSPTHVNVRIELSSDNTHWTLVAQGDGVKQLE
jgi:hypothetical protein